MQPGFHRKAERGVSRQRTLAGLLLAGGLVSPACARHQPPPAPPQPPATLATPTPPAPVSLPAPPAPVSVPAPLPTPTPPAPPRSGAIDCPVKREWTVGLLPERGPFRAELRECASPDALDVPRQQVVLWLAGQPAPAFGLENGDGTDARLLIEKVEPLDLDRDGAQELLIQMRRQGTGGYLEWCLVARKGAGLGCWDAPDIDAPARKLLRADEDFGFHGWELRAQPGRLRLTRGIYRKGIDPNCCPTRGNVVVTLVPRQGALAVAGTTRVAAPPKPKTSGR
jgi:hypothetical protein